VALPVLPIVLTTAAAGIAALIGYRYIQGDQPVPAFLSFGDPVSSFAAKHQIDPRILQAVIEVESDGTALVNGRPVIRVEVHRLEREAAKTGKAGELARRLSRSSRPGEPWTGHLLDGAPLHGQKGETLAQGQRREHEALAYARQVLGDEPALRSTSVGLGQIMGFNAQTAGYPSALAMYEDAKGGRQAQIAQLLRFIEADKGGATLAALQAGDLPQFARYYNGAKVGTPQNANYVSKVKRALT
jgi:hypothetical protein